MRNPDTDSILQLREGTAGKFGNIILTNVRVTGVNQDNCIDGVTNSHYYTDSDSQLYFSSNNIIYNTHVATQFANDGTPACQGLSVADDSDPKLISMPTHIEYKSFFIDPRPQMGSPAFERIDNVPSGMVQTNYKGAFGPSEEDFWVAGWTWLAENDRIPRPDIYGPILCGDITETTTISADQPILLTCQTFVKSGNILIIEPGAMIYGYGDDGTDKAPALVIEQGAKIFADGTAESPITFTSSLATPKKGSWGGLIVLGKALINGGTYNVEGLPNHPCGGTNSEDDSGILRYVRVWYGGRVIGEDNEINGITFGAVGSRTTVEYIEVAFNLDDGVEFFGGSVNVKYVSVLFCEDDGIDTDMGYTGTIQFAFVAMGSTGGHAAEMDGVQGDHTPVRSSPKVYNSLFVGHETYAGDSPSSDDNILDIIRIREGGAGEFANNIISNVIPGHAGVKNDRCDDEGFSNTYSSPNNPDTLWFSTQNIIYLQSPNFNKQTWDNSCGSGYSTRNSVSVKTMDPELVHMPTNFDENSDYVDPRPVKNGRSTDSANYLSSLPDNEFLESVNYLGAFAPDEDLWLFGLSWLSDNDKLPGSIKRSENTFVLGGDITSDDTFVSGTDYLMTETVVVKAGTTLTIMPGTTIRSLKRSLQQTPYNGANGDMPLAPAFIVERDATIIAQGTADMPITFTTAEALKTGTESGMWGGVIILGNAVVCCSQSSTNLVEGVTGHYYGGTDDNDSSGILSYVRIWHGGYVLEQDSEINGLTLAGVGRGTQVDHIEIAFNHDDGIEFFGGAVDVKYLSVLYAGDDGIDADKGYQGRIQYAFVLQGEGSNHLAELDGNKGTSGVSNRRTYPQIYSATFAGTLNNEATTASDSTIVKTALINMREGVGGEFGNLVITNIQEGNAGILNADCDTESRSSALSQPDCRDKNCLWVSPNTRYYAPGTSSFTKIQQNECGGLSVPSSNIDPGLRLMPEMPSETTAMVDPVPTGTADAVVGNVDAVPDDDFFDSVDFVGAFAPASDQNWLDGWSWLSSEGKTPRNFDKEPMYVKDHVTASTQWSGEVVVTTQVHVMNSATLTIAAGTTIYFYNKDNAAPALIIEPNAKIMAVGTADSPITFTSVANDVALPKAGLWGGLIILGNAPTSYGTSPRPEVEGLSGVPYGGSNSLDSSGELQYVRVWYGGYELEPNKEINGITFAGVGSGTTVEHVEVAFNLDDGVEFFGGTVDVKYLSVLFCGDDAIDTDMGYQGRMQYVFVAVGENGHHATEMDSKTGGNVDSQPRSFPKIYNALFVGHLQGTPESQSSDDQVPALLRLREGTGGQFGSTIITNVGSAGVLQNTCGSELRTHSLPNDIVYPNYLWFSDDNIIYVGDSDNSVLYDMDTSCAGGLSKAREVDPELIYIPVDFSENSDYIDPRPVANGNSYRQVGAIPDDEFFDQTNYMGAFPSGNDLWLRGYSWLDENGKLPSDIDSLDATDTVNLCGDITYDLTLETTVSYLLTCQVFVKEGITLTIKPGVTIKALRYSITDTLGQAPALVIERGAKIMAQGTANNPITFTSAETLTSGTEKGLWGGLIILGKATVYGDEAAVEGLEGHMYGGNDDSDNSGILSYVRIWHGGAVIGKDNEINGLTLAGVGSGTQVDHIEVAFNLDDGIEFFGGAVNAKYLSVLFCGDDGIDTDLGYKGKMQFVFVMIGSDGHHGAEMDAKESSTMRSRPQMYNALFVGSLNNIPGSVSSDDQTPAIMRLREGTAGEFGNIIITNIGSYGVYQDKCDSENNRINSGGRPANLDENTLWFSSKTMMWPGESSAFNNKLPCDNSLDTANQSDDPMLLAMPLTADSNIAFLDPRPAMDSPARAAGKYDGVPENDDFFEEANYMGAFDDDLWLSGWSWLDENGRLPANLDSPVYVSGVISSDTTWSASNQYVMTGQVFVQNAKLTIEAGTTVYAYGRSTDADVAPALVIEKGAMIMAQGTASAPITFTSALPERHRTSGGLWGGLIILGEATIAGGTDEVEGIAGKSYGGNNDQDNSGTLSYVRVWYGGSVIGENNEINGITFAGVGSRTQVDHIEVAYNLDDGVEFFGGTVNVKYLSVLFCGDDAIDTDQGYRGKIQFAYVMIGKEGHHATEMDSKTGGNLDSSPRSFPQIFNAHFIGHVSGDAASVSSDDQLEGVMRLREGTAGYFGNIVITNVPGGAPGVYQSDCGSIIVNRDSTLPTENSDTLWFSQNNIIYTPDATSSAFSASDDCAAKITGSENDVDPKMMKMPDLAEDVSAMFDPRPQEGSPLLTSYDSVPSDAWWTPVDFRGAFDRDDLWLSGWSILDDMGKLPKNVAVNDRMDVSGSITSSTTWTSEKPVFLTGQTFVKNGATLTIEAGTTIYAYGDDIEAACLVIEQGAKIEAVGTKDSPITFTSAVPEYSPALPARGLWGGLIINGYARIAGGGTDSVEGLIGDYPYGGNDDEDDSGTLSYVRVWYGGSVLDAAQGDEINGITFAGVGSGTDVDHVEVAYNLDDGFEFFGGTVNAKYLSSIFCGDDAIDTDQGYRGKIQFLFVITGLRGHHGAEMDSKLAGDGLMTPRSFPQVYSATFIGHLNGVPGSVSSDDQIDAMMRLRENTGGEFGNIILTNVGSAGIYQNQCGAETRSHTTKCSDTKDCLWVSEKIIVYGSSGEPYELDDTCTGLSEAKYMDPLLTQVPFDVTENTVTIDPRPLFGSPALVYYDSVPSDGFFEQVDYSGAFARGEELWLTGLSWLSDNGVVPSGSYITSDTIELCGDIRTPTTLYADGDYVMTCQVFVKTGASLTIQRGTTIRATAVSRDNSGKAPALVIERGATITAIGTPNAPITFTTAETVTEDNMRGLWGGLIIMGNAPVEGGNREVEGLEGHIYGGDSSGDSSGTLSYVRIWHGGAVVGQDNEINGLTLAGVGSGTQIDHIEVAYNLDDGIEFFGGTVNAKYLSVLFCGDDAIDTDLGYQGKMQFVYVMTGDDGNHGVEMDGAGAHSPRSFPQMYNALFVGSVNQDATCVSSDDCKAGMMRLREGTGGQFGNIIMANVNQVGLYMNDCDSDVTFEGTLGTHSDDDDDYLFFSSNTLVLGDAAYDDILRGSGCGAGIDTVMSFNNLSEDVFYQMPILANEKVPFIDPRPMPDGKAFQDVDDVPDDGWFDQVNYKGAFGSDLWLAKWSYLSENMMIPRPLEGVVMKGDIITDTTWSADTPILMTGQVFVKSGATLNIQPGATIYGYGDDGSGVACTLVIEQGAKIMAEGSADAPITFTSALEEKHLPRRGTWGGLVILGRATVVGGTSSVEGLEDSAYGGNDDNDNSGVLKYVRVWYGGDVLSSDNEINGITFAGVGRGTTVDYVEVAFNKDDGLEFFGGTVDAKHVSVLFCGDDAIDTDEGYQGRIQYAFVMIGADGHHGTEMDGKGDAPPRSHPMLMSATIIGHNSHNPVEASIGGDAMALMNLREGTGGQFTNLILTNNFNTGVFQDDCASESRGHSQGVSPNNYLWFDDDNIIYSPTGASPYTQVGTCEASLTTAVLSDPLLKRVPQNADYTSTYIDPRPAEDGPACENVYKPAADDDFFEEVTCKGAFEPNTRTWLQDFSWLAENNKLIIIAEDDDIDVLTVSVDITENTRWSGVVYVESQIVVREGATLSIDAGTTVKFAASTEDADGNEVACALIVAQGAKINAFGTVSSPITFTAIGDEQNLIDNPQSQLWGGIIILGRAPIAGRGTREVEGVIGHVYGGDDPNDDSGTLQYVRIWYGGSVIGKDNEINGLTLAGVGRGTTIDYVEVAFNHDDGIEFFGGTVDAKHLSVLFCGDDGIDTDQGYQGRMQFVFVVTGPEGHHATEMDGNNDDDIQPRSFPQVYNGLFVGHIENNPNSASSDDKADGLLRLREGTGGEFGNLIITNVGPNNAAVRQDRCGIEDRTHEIPTSGGTEYLFFSAFNIMNSQGTLYNNPNCPGLSSGLNLDPQFRLMPTHVEYDTAIDPTTPKTINGKASVAYSDVMRLDGWYTSVDYKGAFGDNNMWLSGWSWLSEKGTLVSAQQSNTSDNDSDSSLVVGLVIGLIVAIILLCVAIYFVVQYQQKVLYYEMDKDEENFGGGADVEMAEDVNGGSPVVPHGHMPVATTEM